jgi:hypothetical protein
MSWYEEIPGLLRVILGLFRRRDQARSATFEIPNKTVILVPDGSPRSLWWHMGAKGSDPIMQVVGEFKVTNITRYQVLVVSAKLKKPRTFGMVFVRRQGSNLHGEYPLPPGSTTDLSFRFWVAPPVVQAGEDFVASVAVIDQFGNDHWLKRLRFKYQ